MLDILVKSLLLRGKRIEGEKRRKTGQKGPESTAKIKQEAWFQHVNCGISVIQ